jgi:glutamyl-tRNA reductase
VSLVVIGLNHRTAPLELLERLLIPRTRIEKALADVSSRENVHEAVVLSTCNRTEVYVDADKFHASYGDVRDFLAESGHIAPEEFSDNLYTYYDVDAVTHLFSVVSGLDSGVLGEHEIQGQVKRAWEDSLDNDACGPTLNIAFRHALGVGKRVRTETGISSNIASVSSAAVAMAADRLGGFAGRTVLVVGAGEMGGGMAASIASIDGAEVLVASRRWSRANEVAESVGGRAVHLDEMAEVLLTADVMFTSTGASSIILEHGQISEIMERRGHRPLLIVDTAVPRDVDPASDDIDGITLLDMDDLRAFADAGVREREKETSRAREIIDTELARFLGDRSVRDLAPLITSFRRRICDISQNEFERFEGRLGSLDHDELETVEALVHGIVNKVLHEPTVRLKEAADGPRSDRLADALSELFDL